MWSAQFVFVCALDLLGRSAATALLRQGQVAAAIQQFAMALRLDPTAIDIRTHLAEARRASGH